MTKSPTEARYSRLRTFRVAAQLSQAELGEIAGVARATVGLIERAQCVPRERTARALAAALGVDPAVLFPPEVAGG